MTIVARKLELVYKKANFEMDNGEIDTISN